MTPTVLLCTVGGSHQPILTALREIAPAHVCFLCTGRDPATGTRGSCHQVDGKGAPVEVRQRDGSVERLPNIATQAGLGEGSFQVREVPADDLDGAVRIVIEVIADLAERFPDARIVADYTGGTKTMTAALVMAALEAEGVDLHLVTGARGDLSQVHDGSQASLEVSTEGIRLRRAMAPYLAAWRRHAYGEAAEGLARLPLPRSAERRARLQIARDLSRAFDAWDRFDHAEALGLCDIYRSRLGPVLGRSLLFLSILASGDTPKRAQARL
jgi:CRISPR-associated protein (TIGR02710 family)